MLVFKLLYLIHKYNRMCRGTRLLFSSIDVQLEDKMLDRFKEWLEEVEKSAIDDKKASAKKNGDESLWKKEIWRAPEKNQAIKNKFRDEIEKLKDKEGQQIYRSRLSYKTKAGEWLYDFISRRFDKDHNLIEVFLTMEIELSDSDECNHKYDFYKLLQADSKYKIFVFQSKTKKDVFKGFSSLKNSAQKYIFRLNSDFLFCGWSTSENKFFFDEFNATIFV